MVNNSGIIHVGIILLVLFVGVAAAHVLRDGDFYRTCDSRIGDGLRFCEGGVGERVAPQLGLDLPDALFGQQQPRTGGFRSRCGQKREAEDQ